MVSRSEPGSDPSFGSDRESGRNNERESRVWRGEGRIGGE